MQLTASNPQFAYAPVMNPTFAGGGMTNVAKAVQNQGRGNDSMLVHMTPSEVKGLQALAMAHGGSLTINPNTGLPEAGFLESILPIAAGFALGPAGFALMSAPMAALTVGGITAVASGDLMKGLSAGLGAYGGANLGAALSSTGTEAAKDVALQSAQQQAAQEAAAMNAQQTLAGTNLGSFGNVNAQGFGNVIGSAGAPSVGGFGTVGAQGFGSTLPSASVEQALAATQNAPTGFNAVSAGVRDIGAPGGFGRFGKAFMDSAGGGLGGTLAASGLISPIANALTPQPAFPKVAEATGSTYEGPYYPSERDVRFKDPEDRSTSEFAYFTPSNPVPGYVPYRAASGGLMALAEGGVDLDDGAFVVDARTVSEIGNGSSNAGLERLMKMGAKPIQGPGDGTSDSIRANIGGVQEARVARDEAVFPAEAVKKIGRGNPKAGAKKLYSLMDKAHAARKKAKRGQDTGLAALMA